MGPGPGPDRAGLGLAGAMSDIRHSLLRRDALSAAKEVLYHLDIYFSSQLQNSPLPLVDKGPTDLLEEFLFQVPKERGTPPKVGQGHPGSWGGHSPGEWGWRAGPKSSGQDPCWSLRPQNRTGSLRRGLLLEAEG